MSRKRVLVASEFNARDRAHFSVNYEFCRIISECDDADLVAPGLDNYLARWFGALMPPHDDHNVQRDFNRLVNSFRKSLGFRNTATVERVALERDYDLFFYVAWSPQSLVELTRFRDWRKRCKRSAIYLAEVWGSTIEQDARYLELLDQFDHVFLLHPESVSRLASRTKAQCWWLPPGVDCLAASPYPSPPERVVDIYSIGNRSARLHEQLLALAQRRNYLYLYDSLSSTDSRVKNWREHRLLLANIIKRTRYFITFSPASLESPKAAKIAGEQVLPSRMFEGAVGGAVMLGSAPKCKEFEEQFPWADAVIEVDSTADIGTLIDELDAGADRINRLRHRSMTGCLRRHDWAHRWESVLSILQMKPDPQLLQRKSRLAILADEADTAVAISKQRSGRSHISVQAGF
jgi:hypothetical protein